MQPKKIFPAALFAIFFWSCTPVEETTTPPVNQDTTGTAQLKIINNIEKFPGAYTFYLFNPGALDAQQNPAYKIGTVGEAQSATFTVKAGQWKLAQEDESGLTSALLASPGSSEWTLFDLAKNSSHTLTVYTDTGTAGNGNRWSWQ